MTSVATTSTSARLRILVLWNQNPEDFEEAEEPEDAEDFDQDFEDAEAAGEPGAAAEAPAVPPAVRAVLDALRAGGFVATDINVEDDIDRIAAAVVIERPALIFNLVDQLHGDTALLAALAAYLELLEVPFVGADQACLLACDDRVHAHLVLRDAGIPVPGFQTVRDVAAVPAPGNLRPPLIVTQAFDDVYHDEGRERPLHDFDQVAERVAALAAEYEPPFLIEEYLPERRLHALVLGHGPRDVLPLLEAAPSQPALDADDPAARPWAPAELDPDAAARVGELARRAYRALGCRDVACVDVHLDADGRPHVIDVRPVVDFGPDGLLHAAAERSERGFAGVVVELVQRAVQR